MSFIGYISFLQDIVKRHQGTVVDNPQGATHIVHPMPQAMREEGNKKLFNKFLIIKVSSIKIVFSHRYI